MSGGGSPMKVSVERLATLGYGGQHEQALAAEPLPPTRPQELLAAAAACKEGRSRDQRPPALRGPAGRQPPVPGGPCLLLARGGCQGHPPASCSSSSANCLDPPAKHGYPQQCQRPPAPREQQVPGCVFSSGGGPVLPDEHRDATAGQLAPAAPPASSAKPRRASQTGPCVGKAQGKGCLPRAQDLLNRRDPPAGGKGGLASELARGKGKAGGARAAAPSRAGQAPSCGSVVPAGGAKRLGRQNPNRLLDVLPELPRLARDAAGLELLLARLCAPREAELEACVQAALPEVSAFAADPVAYALVLRLLDLGKPDHLRMIVHQLRGKVLALSKDKYGCWVVQRALDRAPCDAQEVIATELWGHVADCVESMHANHVLSKCVEQLPLAGTAFILRELEDRVVYTACHVYGCRVLQRLLEHCPPPQLNALLDQLVASCWRLASDVYGNVVLRHVLEHGRPEDVQRIIEWMLDEDLVDLATHRCSSLLIEKCLDVSTHGEHAHQLEPWRRRLLQAFLAQEPGRQSPLEPLMEDQFGNYVLQSLMSCARGAERVALCQQLAALEPRLRRSTRGRHVLAAMQREFGVPANTGNPRRRSCGSSWAHTPK